jgi:predicted ribosome-associated RNA-binding protein Tma20
LGFDIWVLRFNKYHELRKKDMNELIEKLKSEAGLTDEQAKKALETIKVYVVEKFPMLEGAVENLFGAG